MGKDIEVLEKLASRTYKINSDGWKTAVCSIDEQLAIRNIIARYKELEKLSENIKMFRDNNLSSEIDYVIALKSNFMEYLKTDYISKSKIEEEFERMIAHNNCFNVGDMNDLLDRILN